MKTVQVELVVLNQPEHALKMGDCFFWLQLWLCSLSEPVLKRYQASLTEPEQVWGLLPESFRERLKADLAPFQEALEKVGIQATLWAASFFAALEGTKWLDESLLDRLSGFWPNWVDFWIKHSGGLPGPSRQIVEESVQDDWLNQLENQLLTLKEVLHREWNTHALGGDTDTVSC